MQRTLTTTRRQNNDRHHAVPAWVVMTDDRRLPDPSPLIPFLPPGSAVIVRHRDAGGATRIATDILPAARRHGVLVLISQATPPARLICDGVHIPETALSNWKACDLARLGPGLVTASAHGAGAVMKAGRLGADAVLLSPVFATESHRHARALGLNRFAAIVRHAGVPVIALGGVTETRIRRLLHAGAAGIAGIGLFRPEKGAL